MSNGVGNLSRAKAVLDLQTASLSVVMSIAAGSSAARSLFGASREMFLGHTHTCRCHHRVLHKCDWASYQLYTCAYYRFGFQTRKRDTQMKSAVAAVVGLLKAKNLAPTTRYCSGCPLRDKIQCQRRPLYRFSK